MKRLIALVLAALMTGCGTQAVNLTDTVNAEKVQEVSVDNDVVTNPMDFSIKFLQRNIGEDNSLVSPLSALYALSMTANGADGETLSQMEAVLGLPLDELNSVLLSWGKSSNHEDSAEVNLANSVWIKNDDKLVVEQEFLRNVKTYYDGEVFTADFNEETRKEINNWVSKNTNEMIPEMLSEIKEEDMLYLINALAFEAEWQDPYLEYQVREGDFTKEDGTIRQAEMMNRTERYYLEDENAVGFVKYYKGGDYAFAALLPKEGVSVEEYVASLNGESVQDLLNNMSAEKVVTSMPKFKVECSFNLNESLQNMGMTDAFDPGLANFSRMGYCGDNGLYISNVLQKTFIEVAEQGTKAGAATAVVMAEGAALPQVEQKPKEVYLNRPFVYMIYDVDSQLPLFMGTLMDVE